MIAWLLLLAIQAAAYDEIRFQKPIKIDEMERPVAVAGTERRVYALDEKKGSIFIFSGEGSLIKSVGRTGNQPGMLAAPKALAIGPDGNIYVADTDNSRVQIFDAEGNSVGGFGGKGSTAGELRYPRGIAVAADGRVYVADTDNNRVQVFTKDGVFLFGFGSKGSKRGEFRSPTRIVVDAADYVYVLDSGNDRIEKFDSKAKFVKEFNMSGGDFWLDAFGFFYTVDPKAGKVREISPDGNIVGTFGSKGTGQGQFKELAAIGQAGSGAFLILDSGGSTIHRVELSTKLKTQPIAANMDAKLLIAGPIRFWPISASVIAPAAANLLAYVPAQSQFVAYDKDGKEQLTFGSKKDKDPGAATGNPLGAAYSEEHGIFVADAGGDRMQRFDHLGKFQSVFAEASGFFDSKKKEGKVKNPHGVAISDKGMIYVADTGNRRVDAFGADGTFLFAIGPKLNNFELQEPVSVAWDKSGFLYFLDRGLKKVFKCEPSGGFKQAWGQAGTGVEEFEDPIALAFDGKNYLYVLDRKARRVNVFNRDGGWVSNFFSASEDAAGLSDPSGVAVHGDELVIADPGRKRVTAFALHPRLAPPVLVSTASAEGLVTLKWKEVADDWTSGYQVLRSTELGGAFETIGKTDKLEFKDNNVAAYHTYYYRLATESKTKDVGTACAQVEIYVAGANNRAPIEIASIEIGNIFSANYKFYEKNPVGKITVLNNVNLPFQNVKVTFRLKDFMDFGTDSVIETLKPQEKVELPLKAVLNNRILDVTEDTPIQAEFTLTYYENGKQQSFSLDKPLRVYSRNTITWDKSERIATFITSKDTPIVEFKSKVLNEATGEKNAIDPAKSIPQALAKAIKLWHGLGVAGVKFQTSGNNPFEQVSQNASFPLDTTQFPRETLKNKSGQCDDLTTLFASLLEASSVHTAILDYPGHMALMFDTGSNDPIEVGLPQEQLIRYNGSFWMPIEMTLIGSSFVDANRYALNSYRERDKKGKASIIDPQKAWQNFEPATMPATNWTADAPKLEDLGQKAGADAASYAKDRYAFLKKYLKEQLNKDGKDVEAMNQLGILEVENGNIDAGSDSFGKALSIDPADASAMNNMGSIAFIKKDYPKAESWFLKAAEKDGDDAGIWLNLAKVSAKIDGKKIQEYGKKAQALDPDNADLKVVLERLSK